jgi:DNA-directed RNA polymerase specialized sigma24 family protein
MTSGGQTATEIDALFARVRDGDQEAFREWMGRVERPIRLSLRRFALAVDVEAIVQETSLRMWLIATRRLRDLEGADSSLRFAIGVARNLARSEARRMGRERHLPPEEMPDDPVDPPATPDPRLAAAIRDCIARLTARLREVLQARITLGPHQPDREIAAGLGMKLNTFLQYVVRARQQVRRCLEGKGVPLSEIPS